MPTQPHQQISTFTCKSNALTANQGSITGLPEGTAYLQSSRHSSKLQINLIKLKTPTNLIEIAIFIMFFECKSPLIDDDLTSRAQSYS